MKQYITQIKRKCRKCPEMFKCSDESNNIFCSIDCLMIANSQSMEKGGVMPYEVGGQAE